MSYLNLYLIERTDEIGYDEFDAHVIAAPCEEDALSMARWDAAIDSDPTCRLIGIALNGVEPGIVLGSFNAG